MSDKTIIYVDPNGDDWFKNKKTGDVYYNKDYTQDNTGDLEGDGWEWMGANDMFQNEDGTNNDATVIEQNIDLASEVFEDIVLVPDPNSEDPENPDLVPQLKQFSASFEGENAEKFMSNMGYKWDKTEEVVIKETSTYYSSEPHTNFEAAKNEKDITTLSVEYDYINKELIHQKITERHIRTISRKHHGFWMQETTKVKRTFKYMENKEVDITPFLQFIIERIADLI